MAVDFDFTIVGGGVIGLACARALARHGSVLLLEQHPHFGTETSSRNSEVIHAGLYYAPGSLKEALCIRGRQQLYNYCQRNDVPHRKTGKLIVAADKDDPALVRLEAKGKALGIPLKRLNATDIRALEPSVSAAEALFSSETGIIDSHTYMQRLVSDASQLGATLMCHTRFERAEPRDDGWQVSVHTSDGACTIRCRTLINAAGLHSHRVAAACGTDMSTLPVLNYCRGHYFSYQARTPFTHLIYPLPEKNLAGLGIHATLDLGGQVRFGPDTQYLDQTETDYSIDPALSAQFAKAVRRYYPALDASQLQPAYAGIRPKLHTADAPAADFVLHLNQTDSPPIMHLLGIESPGLTSSLALADELKKRLIST